MKSDVQNATVKMVTDAFFECVNDLSDKIQLTLDSIPNAAPSEQAYHVNRIIRRWFAAGGRL